MHKLDGFSLIIPTYKEAKNIPALVDRISKVAFETPFEVILIDDNSEDGSVDIVKALSHEHSWLRMVVRTANRDLSQSVIDGFKMAKYPILLTIDADLSHPPEKIPEMLSALTQPNVEVVLGSRYISGGSMDEVWPLSRKIASRMSAWLARGLLGVHLKDPLSGFVGIRKSTLQAGDPLDIIGWKWGLEIMIKCRCKKIVEVPIHFSQRYKGYSKLNLRTALNYFQHIKRLFFYKLTQKKLS